MKVIFLVTGTAYLYPMVEVFIRWFCFTKNGLSVERRHKPVGVITDWWTPLFLLSLAPPSFVRASARLCLCVCGVCLCGLWLCR
jgi:hypothetical protein